MTTLQVGGNIAYASITGSLASTPVNVDQVTVYSGISSSVSALFGGGPVETIISGSGVAQKPTIKWNFNDGYHGGYSTCQAFT